MCEFPPGKGRGRKKGPRVHKKGFSVAILCVLVHNVQSRLVNCIFRASIHATSHRVAREERTKKSAVFVRCHTGEEGHSVHTYCRPLLIRWYKVRTDFFFVRTCSMCRLVSMHCLIKFAIFVGISFLTSSNLFKV